MLIKDPQKLLPTSIQYEEEMANMVLRIPSHGIPLHPKSIYRLLSTIKSGKKAVAFKPQLPVSSGLGLPPYPTLAYLHPQESINNSAQVSQEFEVDIHEDDYRSKFFTLISETHHDEQLHYFANYYGKAIKPSHVRAILGNTCNLKCIMCPFHSPLIKPTHTTKFFQQHQVMSWEMMNKLSKDCGKAKIPIVMGSIEEPMLHPNLVDFVKSCRHQGVPDVLITTNGQLLDESRAKALLEAGLTSIDISIDAVDADTYLRVRGASLSQVESNVINFLKLRDRLGVPCNVRVSLIKNQGVTWEEEQKFRKRWLARADGVFMVSLSQYQEGNMRVAQANDTLQDLVHHYMQKSGGRWACLFPFKEMHVLPDGRVYYCIETFYRLGFDEVESLGDYNTQTLQEIWQGERFQQLRHDLIVNRLNHRSACKNCDLWKTQVVTRSTQNGCQVTKTVATEMYQKPLKIIPQVSIKG